MCLYPKLMLNRRYLPTKKNGYVPQVCLDERTRYVAVGCGNCIECRQQKARAWQVRLQEEFKVNNYAYFITYSFSPESMQALEKKVKDNRKKQRYASILRIKETGVNEVATLATRLYLERWRKKYHVSQKHWFVTELGHTNTERLHIHGIIFSNTPIETAELEKMWSYGNIWVGDYCTERTINYIVKYITKIDEDHKLYKSIVLCSPGLGKNYCESYNASLNKYKKDNTREYYVLNSGQKINLPIYYRNKLYTEEERQNLWIERLNKGEIFVRGIKVNLKEKEGHTNYYKLLKQQQVLSEKAGYGTDSWKLKDYAVTFEMLQTYNNG